MFAPTVAQFAELQVQFIIYNLLMGLYFVQTITNVFSIRLNLPNKVVANNIKSGCIPLGCISARVLLLCMPAHWHGLLGHLNGAEPPVMLLVTPDKQIVCCVRGKDLY